MTHSAAGAPHTAEHDHHAPADARRWAALALICLAQFMLILDVTVVNVALPDMAADLDLGRETLTWVVTAYTLLLHRHPGKLSPLPRELEGSARA